MNSLEMENEIRVLLGSGEIGALEGLLVDSADWGAVSYTHLTLPTTD